MKRIGKMAFLLGLFGIMLTIDAPYLFAEDFYIAQNQEGTGAGSSCTSAVAYTWFNNEGNWANPKLKGKIGPGDTVHLCGTISSKMEIRGSGDGQTGVNHGPITIYWEPNAKLSRPVGTLISAINYSQPYSYFVFDGGTNGVIENTSNGDSLANQAEVNGFYAQTMAFVEIKNLTFRNLYVRTPGASPPPAQGTGFFMNGMGGDLSIHDCTFHDIGTIITTNAAVGSSSKFRYYNNKMYNFNHAMEIGGYFASANIFSNHFGECSVWSYPEPQDLGFHRDGIFLTYPNGVTANGYKIYNNLFDGSWGTKVTAHIYFSGDAAGNAKGATNFLIFNNVFIQYPGESFPLIMGGGVGFGWYNNTFIGNGSTNRAITASCADWTFKNNLISDFRTFFTEAIISPYPNGFSGNGLNNNIYASSHALPFQYGGDNHSFPSWQGHTGQDAISSCLTNAKINIDGTLQTESLAVGAGANLSSLGIIELNSDKAGNPRPSIGNWAVGAYEHTGSLSLSSVPSNLRIE